MSRRIVTSFIGPIGLAALAAFLAPSAAAQAQTAVEGSPKAVAAAKKPSAASTKAGTKRTPWGDPDLQGTWDYRTITPLERPQNMGDRQY